MVMEKTTTLSVRIDSDVKKKAEIIMDLLGLTPSMVIQMLYRQIIYTRSLPFNVHLPDKPIAIGGMSEEEITKLLDDGHESAKYGTYTPEEADEMLKKI